MRQPTKEIIETVLNADDTVDKRVIASVMQLLESFDTRTREQIEKEVADCVMQYLTEDKRTKTAIEGIVNHKFRINPLPPNLRFNAIALDVVEDITNNPKKYNVLCQDKGGSRKYFYKVDKQ